MSGALKSIGADALRKRSGEDGVCAALLTLKPLLNSRTVLHYFDNSVILRSRFQGALHKATSSERRFFTFQLLKLSINISI
jgi:hypothetical protein